MKIRVIDSPCGTGKTEWAIRYMNENCENSRFIYVTPYLDEIKRVRENVSFDMQEPKDGSKSKDLEALIIKGSHIATTHALFGKGNEELNVSIKSQGYEIILDEVMTVLQPLDLGAGDIEILLKNNYISVADDNVVSVTEEGWSIARKKVKYKKDFELISGGNVLFIGNCMMVWEFPASLLKSFKQISILTYLFKEQTMYNFLSINGAKFSFSYLENYELKDGIISYDGSKYKELVNIYNGKLNSVGEQYYSLSSSWYIKEGNHSSKKILENNTHNYFKRIAKTVSNKALWTCKLRNEDCSKGKKIPMIKVNNYITSFLEMTARATNLYADRDTCAYLVNRFENPVIYNYFKKHGLSVNDDVFALSELIQWLFRSAIRKNKPINLYIPSKRMRELLQSWLDGSFDERYNNGGK